MAVNILPQTQAICPRCTRPIRRTDSQATVISSAGATEDIHAGCLDDGDDLLEYQGQRERVRAAQASWSEEDFEVAA